MVETFGSIKFRGDKLSQSLGAKIGFHGYKVFSLCSGIKNHLKISSSFCQEALEGISKLNTWKHISDINKEHLFYNPVFQTIIDEDIRDRNTETL